MKYLRDINNIHKMKIKRGREIDMDLNELRFNHYNVNPKLLVWMKDWYDRKDFQYSKDTSMYIYKDKIDLNERYCSVAWRKSLLNLH